jgi:hypothetical protein
MAFVGHSALQTGQRMHNGEVFLAFPSKAIYVLIMHYDHSVMFVDVYLQVKMEMWKNA